MKAIRDIPKKIKDQRETGFSLVEIMVALVVLGIVAAIAIPVFSNAQKELDSKQIKSELTQAAILIETEALDNNGLYPTYIPNEVLKLTQGTPGSNSNSAYNLSKVIYTYSVDRTHWCLQTDSPLGKLFISDTNKEPGGNVCTQAMVGSNSDTPWDVPDVPVPSVKTFTNAWASTSNTAVATITINPVVCDLNADDGDEWGDQFRTEYSVRLLNTTRSNPVINPTAWGTATTVTVNLSGWLPDDTISAEVRARCVTDFGTGYQYTGEYSAKKTGKVAWFTVNNVAWVNVPSVTWPAANAAPRYTTSWTATAFCPSGTPHYALNASGTLHSTGASGTLLQVGSSTGTPTAWASGYTGDLSTNTRGGTSVTSLMKVVCKLSDGRLRASSGITHTITTLPIKAPSGNPTITSNNSGSDTSVHPNRISWSANGATCQVGTLQYLVKRTSPSAATIGNWVTSSYSDQKHTAGTSYTYSVETRCANGSVTSATRGPVTTTFTAAWNIPPAPSKVSSFGNNGSGTAAVKNNRLTWGAVTCQDSTTEYRVRQNIKSGAAIAEASRPASGWVTSTYLDIPASWLAPGNTVRFEVNARCTGPGGSSPETGYATSDTGAKWTTQISAPSAPRNVSVARTGKVTWTAPATTCQSGATIKYRLKNVTNGKTEGWVTALTDTSSSWNNWGGQTYKVQVDAICTGANLNSSISNAASDSITIPWTTGTITTHVPRNCSNFRTGPGTNYGVSDCIYGGPTLTVYQYCSKSDYTWVRTSKGWTTRNNMNNIALTYLKPQC